MFVPGDRSATASALPILDDDRARHQFGGVTTYRSYAKARRPHRGMLLGPGAAASGPKRPAFCLYRSCVLIFEIRLQCLIAPFGGEEAFVGALLVPDGAELPDAEGAEVGPGTLEEME